MTWTSTHQPCDDCGSSDAKSYDDTGSGYCFACRTRTKGDKALEQAPVSAPKQAPLGELKAVLLTGQYGAIMDRRLTADTAQRYSAYVQGGNTYFGYYQGTDLLAVKQRTDDKRFLIKGQWNQCGLFGMHAFPAGGKYLTITEGEYDAMAVNQMFENKGAAVSVRNGASGAVKDCRDNYEYIDSFDEIILAFDGDEPGQKAAKEVAELFGNKAKIVKMSSAKDANEYLLKGKAEEFKKAWWNAERFVPDGIVPVQDLLEAVCVPLERSKISYPWEKLNSMLFGIRPAELVTLCAGSGLGKSTILREIALNMLTQSEDPIGMMFLEETPERTVRGLIGLEMNKQIHLPECHYTREEVIKAAEKLRLKDRVFLWDSFGSNEIERVLGRMRYMVKATGCKFIILDHLSILVSDQANGDERKAIDMCMTKLRVFAQEMRITLLVVSHLKRPEGRSLEDGAATSLGQLRGSAAIAQLSDVVIGAERNSQAEDEDERNTTKLRVLKNRFAGVTGPAGMLRYNTDTGRLTDYVEADAL